MNTHIDLPRRLTPGQSCEYMLNKHNVRHTTKTLAKLRCIGGGPRFQKFGNSVFYTPPHLDEYVESRLSPVVNSTSEFAAIRQGRIQGSEISPRRVTVDEGQ